MENPVAGPANISLLNINGQVLNTEDLDFSSGTFKMDLSAYPSGIYMIKIQTDEAQTIRKVIRQ